MGVMRVRVNKMTFILFLIAGSLLGAAECQAKPLDVELVWRFSQAGWLEIRVEEGAYRFDDGQTEERLTAGASLQVGWGGWTPVRRLNQDVFAMTASSLRLLDEEHGGCFSVRLPGEKEYVYRGDLIIDWQEDHWRLINRLEEEEYLKGVVPIEMSNAWAGDGLEALKAQAVAARTFMAKHTQGGRGITDSPDVDQAYGGKNAEGEASEAVAATRSEILVDALSGEPIDAFYSAHNGGYTEEAENVWGNPDEHYSAHADDFSRGVGGAADQWQFTVAASQLGRAFGLTPVRQVTLEKYPSGRVKTVTLTDRDGETRLLSGRALVRAFYPYGREISSDSFLGSLFEVSFLPSAAPDRLSKAVDWLRNRFQSEERRGQSAGSRTEPILRSVWEIMSEGRADGVFTFQGHGWGHGVGMSQWGAYHMAQMGFSYRDILRYYYEQTELAELRPTT
ncbi:MAG: SpoIID/LytB domain-containing protein [Peptococcaceae bacterium]|nr:SpoIID/LytB domain-containing protein [Peptococcaceae bacterium]